MVERRPEGLGFSRFFKLKGTFETNRAMFEISERCPVTARPDGTAGNERVSEGTGRNPAILIMRGRSSVG